MTKVKGIETKQIVLEVIMGLISIVCAVMMFSLYLVEADKPSFYKSNNETIFYILSLVFLIWGMIEFVCIFKKMGNYVEIHSEKISIKSFSLQHLQMQQKSQI